MFAVKEMENRDKYVEVLSNLMNTTDGINIIKLVSNYVEKTSSRDNKLKAEDESIFSNRSMREKYLNNLVDYMIEISMDSDKKYTTGELAKYFGVSITSINNWVNEGRFINIKRDTKNKQLRIPENILWKAPSGELISIKEVVDMYEEDTSISKEEEINYINENIKFFENLYGGSFEETLKIKENKTPREESDASEWEYELKKLAEK